MMAGWGVITALVTMSPLCLDQSSGAVGEVSPGTEDFS